MAKLFRCAVYTRKSSEEGLEQEFNSLHAQREACEAYIKSQKHEGWRLVDAAYDDGGISGGTMERPGLKQLLADIVARKIDVVVVYKVDRLTRALADFAKMVEVFDKHSVSFVSVTQQFNTTTSMGRLTLNVLLSFAQFEREVTSERIRDKIAASAKKGIWMGGPLPLGYGVLDRKLFIKPEEAERVRHIYARYLELGCVRLLQRDLERRGIRSPQGFVMPRSSLYKLLTNPIYIGLIRHKTERYPGQHEALMDKELWERVQAHLAYNRRGSKTQSRKTELSPLNGKLFDVSGEPLTSVHAKKKERRYRYYISQSLGNNPRSEAPNGWRLPGRELEQTLIRAARHMLDDHTAVMTALHEAEIPPHQIKTIISSFKPLDDEAIIETILTRAELAADEVTLTLSLLPSTNDTYPPMHENNAPITLTQSIPMRIKRRGVETRLIMGDSAPAHIDPTLLRAIARAQTWLAEFLSGTMPSMAAIAKRDRVDSGALSHMLSLAFLAPDIIETIIAGRQPADLTTQKLLRGIDIPMDWAAQKRALGFK